MRPGLPAFFLTLALGVPLSVLVGGIRDCVRAPFQRYRSFRPLARQWWPVSVAGRPRWHRQTNPEHEMAVDGPSHRTQDTGMSRRTMSALTVVTPSFLGDFELFGDYTARCSLNQRETVHHVIVPPTTSDLFHLCRARCTVWLVGATTSPLPPYAAARSLANTHSRGHRSRLGAAAGSQIAAQRPLRPGSADAGLRCTPGPTYHDGRFTTGERLRLTGPTMQFHAGMVRHVQLAPCGPPTLGLPAPVSADARLCQLTQRVGPGDGASDAGSHHNRHGRCWLTHSRLSCTSRSSSCTGCS